MSARRTAGVEFPALSSLRLAAAPLVNSGRGECRERLGSRSDGVGANCWGRVPLGGSNQRSYLIIIIDLLAASAMRSHTLSLIAPGPVLPCRPAVFDVHELVHGHVRQR
jgi:hypothetical protein